MLLTCLCARVSQAHANKLGRKAKEIHTGEKPAGEAFAPIPVSKLIRATCSLVSWSLMAIMTEVRTGGDGTRQQEAAGTERSRQGTQRAAATTEARQDDGTGGGGKGPGPGRSTKTRVRTRCGMISGYNHERDMNDVPQGMGGTGLPPLISNFSTTPPLKEVCMYVVLARLDGAWT